MEKTRYINEKEVAEITGMSVKRLRNDRFLNQGLPYHKIGRSVRYSLSDIFTFMNGCRIEQKA